MITSAKNAIKCGQVRKIEPMGEGRLHSVPFFLLCAAACRPENLRLDWVPHSTSVFMGQGLSSGRWQPSLQPILSNRYPAPEISRPPIGQSKDAFKQLPLGNPCYVFFPSSAKVLLIHPDFEPPDIDPSRPLTPCPQTILSQCPLPPTLLPLPPFFYDCESKLSDNSPSPHNNVSMWGGGVHGNMQRYTSL